MTFHNPGRPTWECLGCGGQWPCEQRKKELLAEHIDAPTSLHVYLAAQLLDAMKDLPQVPSGDLFMRFMGWLPLNQQPHTEDPGEGHIDYTGRRRQDNPPPRGVAPVPRQGGLR